MSAQCDAAWAEAQRVEAHFTGLLQAAGVREAWRFAACAQQMGLLRAQSLVVLTENLQRWTHDYHVYMKARLATELDSELGRKVVAGEQLAIGHRRFYAMRLAAAGGRFLTRPLAQAGSGNSAEMHAHLGENRPDCLALGGGD